jgi:dTDP-4-amino-4,6-dideoxygalactose transaminase
VFHYVPLHSAPMGRKAGRAFGDLTNTSNLSERLVRLPLWLGIEEHMAFVIQEVIAAAS